MRLPRLSLPTAVVLAACGLVLAAVGVSALSGGSVPRVEVAVSIPSDGRLPSRDVHSLLVRLTTSAEALEPRFFIVLGPIVYAWSAEGSQRFVGPGTITYRISAPCPDCTIPSGAVLLVRVYDALSRSYSFSSPYRV